MKKYLLTIILLLIAVFSIAAISSTWFGNMFVSSDQVTFSWTDDQNVEHYEIELLWLDQNPPMIFPVGNTTEKEIIVERPRTGHFSLRVRGCNNNGCSEWAISTNEEDTFDNIPFRIYFAVPPVNDIIIN